MCRECIANETSSDEQKQYCRNIPGSDPNTGHDCPIWQNAACFNAKTEKRDGGPGEEFEYHKGCSTFRLDRTVSKICLNGCCCSYLYLYISICVKSVNLFEVLAGARLFYFWIKNVSRSQAGTKGLRCHGAEPSQNNSQISQNHGAQNGRKLNLIAQGRFFSWKPKFIVLSNKTGSGTNNWWLWTHFRSFFYYGEIWKYHQNCGAWCLFV